MFVLKLASVSILVINTVGALPQLFESLEDRAPACGPKFFRANFDDIETPELYYLQQAEVNDEPIGNYMGLNWDLYALHSNVYISQIGLDPQSAPNVAVLDRVPDRVQRRPHLVSAQSQNGTFQLNTFYFGCTFEDTEVFPCNLTISGLLNDGTETAPQLIQFVPELRPPYINEPMVQIRPTFAKQPIHAVKLTPTGYTEAPVSYNFDGFAWTPCA